MRFSDWEDRLKQELQSMSNKQDKEKGPAQRREDILHSMFTT
jgi:hypothetical protein